MPKKKKKTEKYTVGWREWLAMPALGVNQIKAKVDTGARSSSLHVTDLEVVEEDGVSIARFTVHPLQRRSKPCFKAQAVVTEKRVIRSSNGHSSLRPVIETEVILGEYRFSCELTLTSRDDMGFRMLLGREAVRRRAVVDPGRSYVRGKPLT